MTRSYKQNDRDHAGLADGTADDIQHLPRYFAKHGHADADPKKVKKEGGGKGNWGQPGDECANMGYNFTNARRRSNSSSASHHLNDFKTKFEHVEADPVFEESYGPLDQDVDADAHAKTSLFGDSVSSEASSSVLDKSETADSISTVSVDEEELAKKV